MIQAPYYSSDQMLVYAGIKINIAKNEVVFSKNFYF